MVVGAHHGRARQDAHLGIAAELGDCARQPLAGGGAIERLASAQQVAACLGLLVREDHAGARAARGECGGEAGRAGADHQHVAVGVHPVIERAVVGGLEPPPAG